MSVQPIQLESLFDKPREALGRLLRVNRLLAVVGSAHLILLVAFAIGVFVDPRLVMGYPAWLKPAKFALSIGIYSLTVLWMLSYVSGKPRFVKLVASVIAVGFVVEILGIGGQATRGVGSHFNVASAFDSLVYSIMGGAIAIVTTMLLLVAGVLIRQKGHDVAFRWALVFALVITTVGSYMAFTMTAPKPEQLEAWQNGAPVLSAGGHAVGAPEDGPGLPVLGWSTLGGDLRVAHFVGIHAMQVLPLVGWLATRRRAKRALSDAGRVTLVVAGGLAYLGLILVLYWQALRGQSVIAPDGLTWAGFAGVALVALTVAGLALTAGRRKRALSRLVPAE